MVEPVAVTVGTAGAFSTFAVIALDVAGLFKAPEMLEVIMQVMTSLLLRLELVQVGLLVPTFEPFLFHW